MKTFSLCMIVKNEEEVLARCLDSACGIFDEIVIVDTGSSDKTKEIALDYTEKVYDFEWIYDFSAARNFAFSKATSDYIMWLDADDIIKKKDRDRLIELKSTLDDSTDIVMLKYNTNFDEDGNPTFSYYRERLFKRANNYKWEGAIHEIINLIGKIEHLDIAITHSKLKSGDPKRNLKIFEKMIKNGKELSPRDQFYYGRELYYNKLYKRAIKVLEGFINSGKGWSQNCYSACLDISRCYAELGDEGKQLDTLLHSFRYDNPRAETCCELGAFYQKRKDYARAAYWYESALLCKKDETTGGFYLADTYDYIPYIELCVCYYNLGNIESAKVYNEFAGQIKPKSKTYLFNKEFFAGLK